MTIRPLADSDWPEWLRMRLALWPEESATEHERGMREVRAQADAAVFVAERADGSVCGFVEAGTRSVADGCETSPVGYIEGWWVDEDVRRRGVGRALVDAAEDWAREMGYREMGSDAVIDNVGSQLAHQRLGYEEVVRTVVFRKTLAPLRRSEAVPRLPVADA